MNISETLERLAEAISIPDVVICTVGTVLFAVWLVKSSFGRDALADSVPRRNNMPAHLPFVLLFIWFVLIGTGALLTTGLVDSLEEWQGAFVDNAVVCASGAAATVVIIFLARAHFARRLKGFGLNVKTIHKDIFGAVINLLAAWPFVTGAIALTFLLGLLTKGPEFEIERHESLTQIGAYEQTPLRILIAVVAVVVAPLLEEMLFRGLFQTTIRSLLAESRLGKRLGNSWAVPWLSILIASGLFATVHAYAGHWPALFVLGICMGYAYEKSGSLFRPIFIHALFNTTSVIAAFYQ
ncbi:MAG: CPBP family intramembrane metalloprotease [Planctomycetota bacterium]|nr:MAG: CPBP family intramembrane metalloprotease [Planctomycetota bacterium]